MTQIMHKNINGKTLYLVEDHHHILLPWTELRMQLETPPHILSLDHHTDTLPAFTHYNETHESPHDKKLECCTLPSIESVLPDLRHDEHFDFAVENGIISSAAIFSHVNFSRNVNPALRIIHDPPPDEQRETLAQYYAKALETEFLCKNLRRAPLPAERPYILDIDLDYFKGEKSVHPEDDSLFKELIRNAAAITISRERDWVRLLNMDYGNRLSSYFENAVLKMVAEA